MPERVHRLAESVGRGFRAPGTEAPTGIAGETPVLRVEAILALEPNLDQYYQGNVIGGPNAFMIVAETFEAFAEAVLKKLITEIAAAPAETQVAMAPDP